MPTAVNSILFTINGKRISFFISDFYPIYINDVNPSNATVVEMRALEAHYKVEKQGGFTSLPLEAGNMGLNDRRDFIAMFKKSIEDLNKLGRFDLSLLWTKSMDTYLNLPNANSKYK